MALTKVTYSMVDGPIVHVKDFGAVGNGTTDDTAAIQAAIDAGTTVLCDPLTYKVAGTLTIPSNRHICGSPDTEFIGIMTVESTGGYPNQMIYSTGTENIRFSDINFNFARGSFGRASGAGLTSINSLYFVSVDGLYFERCTFDDFSTNYNSSLTGKALLAFGMSQFDDCKNVSFSEIKSSRIFEEGFQFYECEAVSFNNWEADGVTVFTSSHAGIWYCDGVSITNTKISHRGGSVINCYSRNVLYENISVNDGLTQQGRGFDFGNELGSVTGFAINNIKVSNCALNVKGYGITFLTFGGSGTLNDVVEAMLIDNNTIKVDTDDLGRNNGIQLQNPKAVSVTNNYIYLSDVTNSGIGKCVQFFLSPTASVTQEHSNVTVANNWMRGSTFMQFDIGSDTSLDGVFVNGNTFVSQNIGALSSFQGAATFFNVTNSAGATNEFDLSNVYISQNVAQNCGGGFVTTTANNPTAITLSNIQITYNSVYGPSASNADRCVGLDASGGGSADVVMSNNIFENMNQCIFKALESFTADRNIWRWTSALANRRVMFRNHNGVVEFTNNRMYYVDSTYDDVYEDVAGSYTIVNISGNASQNTGGTLVFNTNMPANTVLPN